MHKTVAALLLATGIGLATPALAQTAVEGRVDRLEHEMRAVQRKVFPGANGRYVEPDVTAPEQAGPVPGTPASNPVADLTGRVNALESQMAQITGASEQNQHRLQQLEDAFNAYKRTTDARLKALEDAATTTTPPPGAGDGTLGDEPPTASRSSGPRTPPPSTAKGKTGATTSRDPARAKLVAAVEKPETDDPTEDQYIYGYRLWQAKLYPEAEAALGDVVTQYPKSRRASFAQNLLGRSYLEEGKPALASQAFYKNYKTYPDGERAPESLYYLGSALMKLGKPADACKVYGELNDVYGAKISPEMKANTVRAQNEAKCK